MPTVLHAPSATLAATLNPTLTVEAEYGSVVAEGSRYTAAHHQADPVAKPGGAPSPQRPARRLARARRPPGAAPRPRFRPAAPALAQLPARSLSGGRRPAPIAACARRG